ncbi:HAD family hydrolase [Caproiciproducens sp. CPB-2]|uniref:HAD family hydrolase n=1 Tax=Caproiciproducens sp. CPB-2 TaxID=3030017 RepID=UPI0023DC0135|nr:HAD family phosphatase [Caproiciproducens sp. CPB-2]MDF1494509.1 HAD family phosphatase [Caproiciproducens sp. CPB-2]
MINNIVFDMGQVLVDFNPDFFISHYTRDPEDIRLIRSKVFETGTWKEIDRGTITEEDLIEPVCSCLPERLHGAATELLLNWIDHMQVLDNILPLVRELKENGYSLYLLSNAGKKIHSITPRITALQYFSGVFFSADFHCIKPDEEIYRKFFKEFSLDPRECYFIDDRADNVEAGRKLGMEGHCYEGDPDVLRTALRENGIFLLDKMIVGR